ncbi:MAG: hypothetical protein KBB21_35595 [Nannocystaceae bacterium]|nr:hypothetical protein [Deltaproteobacteria bacterium]MBP7292007.1 hypothetical protein [Nannocystaceae bacterium]
MPALDIEVRVSPPAPGPRHATPQLAFFADARRMRRIVHSCPSERATLEPCAAPGTWRGSIAVESLASLLFELQWHGVTPGSTWLLRLTSSGATVLAATGIATQSVQHIVGVTAP